MTSMVKASLARNTPESYWPTHCVRMALSKTVNSLTNASINSLINGTVDSILNKTFLSLLNTTYNKNGTEGAVVQTILNLIKVTKALPCYFG